MISEAFILCTRLNISNKFQYFQETFCRIFCRGKLQTLSCCPWRRVCPFLNHEHPVSGNENGRVSASATANHNDLGDIVDIPNRSMPDSTGNQAIQMSLVEVTQTTSTVA